MSTDYSRELAVAVSAVRQAAALCQAVQAESATRPAADSMAKQDKSPVTIADYGSQALICRALAAAFPNDPIVGEEDAAALRQDDQAAILQQVVHHVAAHAPGASASEVCGWIDHGGARAYAHRFWTLDPIDGTKGFLRREQYAVSLALIVDGQITVAVLGCPNLWPLESEAGTSASTGWLFTAIRGQGAFAQPLFPGDSQAAVAAHAPQQIHVTTHARREQARVCESVESGHSDQSSSAQMIRQLGLAGKPVRLDSQAKYAVVARGEAEIYLRLPTRPGYREKIWDHAGGVLVVEEAGGRVTDVDGRPLDFTQGSDLAKNRGVIVTHGPFHDDVVQAWRNVSGDEAGGAAS